MIKTILLILGCISFIIVIGGATYEHAAVVPVWSSAVPKSLSMFQGEYGLAPANFWIPVHPVTMILLTSGMIANWKTPRRAYVIAAILGYAAVLAVTFMYFVPELMTITQIGVQCNRRHRSDETCESLGDAEPCAPGFFGCVGDRSVVGFE